MIGYILSTTCAYARSREQMRKRDEKSYAKVRNWMNVPSCLNSCTELVTPITQQEMYIGEKTGLRHVNILVSGSMLSTRRQFLFLFLSFGDIDLPGLHGESHSCSILAIACAESCTELSIASTFSPFSLPFLPIKEGYRGNGQRTRMDLVRTHVHVCEHMLFVLLVHIYTSIRIGSTPNCVIADFANTHPYIERSCSGCTSQQYY